MTQLAAAFQNRKIVSGWHFESATLEGHGIYRGPEGWKALPVTSRALFVGYAVYTDKGVFVGTVKSVQELP